MRVVPAMLVMSILSWSCSPITAQEGAEDPTMGQARAPAGRVGSAVVDPNDIWLFTDPRARARFPANVLARDVRAEVMQGGTWMPDEIEYQREILRLQREGIVVSVAYWHVSPFPTVYQALHDGYLTVGGRRYDFRVGDAITFQCRMARVRNPSLTGPLMIFQRRPSKRLSLCGDMKRASRPMSR